MSKCIDDDEVIYYNGSLFLAYDENLAPAQINDIRSDYIIKHPELYEMSVVRFDITTAYLPAVIAPMANAIPALGFQPTQWWVSFVFGGNTYSQQVTIEVATEATYGFIYTIDAVLGNVNIALATAFAAIPGVTVTNPPIFAFDPTTQLINIYYGQDYLTVVGAPEVWLNSTLYSYLPTFPNNAFNGYNNANKLDARLNLNATQSVFLGAGPAYVGEPYIVNAALIANCIKMPQSGIVMDSWSSIRSIYITSTTLPVKREFIPTSNNALGQTRNASENSLPIISDFLLSSDVEINPIVDRVRITYLPTAEYRMINMTCGLELKRLDMKFWFSDHNGVSREMFLAPGGYVSVKLMFRRKHHLT